MTTNWRGPIGFEGLSTGDNRYIEEGALRWDTLPMPLRHASKDVGAHDGAEVAGHINTIERLSATDPEVLEYAERHNVSIPEEATVVWATGDFDLEGDVGKEAARHVKNELTNGISMDLDDVSFEVRVGQKIVSQDGATLSAEDQEVMVTTTARVRAATQVAIPAFEGARIEWVADDAAEEQLASKSDDPTADAESGAEDSGAEDSGAEDSGTEESGAEESGADDVPPTHEVDGNPDIIDISKIDPKEFDVDEDGDLDTDEAIAMVVAVLEQISEPRKQAAALKQRVTMASAGRESLAAVADATGTWTQKYGEHDVLAKPSEVLPLAMEQFDQIAEALANDESSGLTKVTADDVIEFLAERFHATGQKGIQLGRALGNLETAVAATDDALKSGDSTEIKVAGEALKNASWDVEDCIFAVRFFEWEQTNESDEDVAFRRAFSDAWNANSDELCSLLSEVNQGAYYMRDLGDMAEAIEQAVAELEGLKLSDSSAQREVTQAVKTLGAGSAEAVDQAVVQLCTAKDADGTTNAEAKEIRAILDYLAPVGESGSVDSALWKAAEAKRPASAPGADVIVKAGSGLVEQSDITINVGEMPQPAPVTEYYDDDYALAAPAWGAQTATYKKRNWVEKTGGLPKYIKFLANKLQEHNGWAQSKAIAVAVNLVKRWARGGTVTGKAKGPHVNAGTIAKAQAALAEWEAKKAAAHATSTIGVQSMAGLAGAWVAAAWSGFDALAGLSQEDRDTMFETAAKAAAVSLGWKEKDGSFQDKAGWTISQHSPNDPEDTTWDILDKDGNLVGTEPSLVLAAATAADKQAGGGADSGAESGAEDSGAESGAESGADESGAESGAADSGAEDSGAEDSGKPKKKLSTTSRLELPKSPLATDVADSTDLLAGVERAMYEPEQRASLVASGATLAAPVAPPKAWFTREEPNHVQPLTVTESGEVYGHLASYDVCHLAMPNGVSECVTAPRSETGYSLFHLGYVTTAEGDDVRVGRITMNTGHAADHWNPRQTLAHYENTGLAVADVHARDGKHGIWLSGALRPDATPEQIRTLKASPLSGDWRRFGAGMELTMALAVNQPGFPIATRGLVASGALQTLVSAGPVPVDEADAQRLYGDLTPEDVRYLRASAQRERDLQGAELASKVFEIKAPIMERQVEDFAARRKVASFAARRATEKGL